MTDSISKDSLWAAFQRYDECQSHSPEECKILNNLFNMALFIERGHTVEEAYTMLREIEPLDKPATT